MIETVTINGNELLTTYNYYLASKTIGKAEPRLSLVEIPGADGFADLSEALGPIKYEYRDIELSLIDITQNSISNYAKIQNDLNGKKVKLTFSDDPDWHYEGRAIVGDLQSDPPAHKIDIEVSCQPYKRKNSETIVEEQLTTNGVNIILDNYAMPVIPSIEVNKETTIIFGEYTTTINSGTHTLPNVVLDAGENMINASSDGGTIIIKYTEGSL